MHPPFLSYNPHYFLEMLKGQDMQKATTSVIKVYDYKYLLFLAVLYFTGWAVSYPVAYKFLSFHHMLICASMLFFPVTYAVADIITEIYGYRIARQVLWVSIICGFFFATALEVIAYLPINPNGQTCHGFHMVFGHIFRVYTALTIASIIGNFFNIIIMSRIKVMLQGRLFWLRSFISTAAGEAIFTIIGGLMIYTGIKSWGVLINIMLTAYLFKMVYSFIIVWPSYVCVAILKKAENLDAYDIGISYNPFKMSND